MKSPDQGRGGRRLGQLLGTPFGLAVLGCLVLAGWALWTGGILDGPIARQVRTSSVYAAPGVELDQTAAEQIIGNRRLVVAILEPGADLRDGCHSVERAAAGTVVLLLSRESDDEYDKYGCALLPGRDDENFGRAAVAESVVSRGVDEFADRPLETLKVVAVNYDLLVRAGTVPDGARTISPSLPRYLIAAAAILAVLMGSTVLYAGARRAGRLTAAVRARREATADRRSGLSAAAAVLAQQIIDLDREYGRVVRADAVGRGSRGRPGRGAGVRGGRGDAAGDEQRAFARKYRQLTSEYTELLASIAAADSRSAVAHSGAAVPDSGAAVPDSEDAPSGALSQRGCGLSQRDRGSGQRDCCPGQPAGRRHRQVRRTDREPDQAGPSPGGDPVGRHLT